MQIFCFRIVQLYTHTYQGILRKKYSNFTYLFKDHSYKTLIFFPKKLPHIMGFWANIKSFRVPTFYHYIYLHVCTSWLPKSALPLGFPAWWVLHPPSRVPLYLSPHTLRPGGGPTMVTSIGYIHVCYKTHNPILQNSFSCVAYWFFEQFFHFFSNTFKF